MTHQREIVRRRNAAGAAADDRHFLARGGQGFGHGHFARVFHRVAFEAADVDGGVHHAPATAHFAGVFADEPAHRHEGVVLADEAHGVRASARFDEGYVARNVHARRALRHAGNGLVEGAFATPVFDVFDEIVAESFDSFQDHARRFVADGAVGGIVDALRRLPDEFDGVQRRVAVQNVVQKFFQRPQPDAAGHAFAAGLGMAHLQKGCRHIHGAKPGRAGADAAFHIFVQLLHGGLRLVLRNDTQSAHNSSRVFPPREIPTAILPIFPAPFRAPSVSVRTRGKFIPTLLFYHKRNGMSNKK